MLAPPLGGPAAVDERALAKPGQGESNGHGRQLLPQLAVGRQFLEIQLVGLESVAAFGNELEDVAGVHPGAQHRDPVPDELLDEPVVPGACEAVLRQDLQQPLVRHPPIDALLEALRRALLLRVHPVEAGRHRRAQVASRGVVRRL